MRAFLGRRRGATGRFCREIPGFLGGARVRRGDSAHGGRCRGDWAKKFLKNFLKGVENLKIGVWEGPEGGLGAPYIERAGRRLGLDTRPLAALLEMRRDTRGSPLLYIEDLFASSIARFMRGISACPSCNSLTFTCGLRLPACRMLVTTISSQSRQENPCQKRSSHF